MTSMNTPHIGTPVKRRRVQGIGFLWEQSEVDRLKELRAAGKTVAEMSEALGRGFWAVHRKVELMVRSGEIDKLQAGSGGKKNQWTEAEAKFFQELFDAGLFPSAIRRAFDEKVAEGVPGFQRRSQAALASRYKNTKAELTAPKVKPVKQRTVTTRRAAPAAAVSESPAEVNHHPQHRGTFNTFLVPLRKASVSLIGWTFSAPEMPLETDRRELREWLKAAEAEGWTPAADLHLVEGLMSGAFNLKGWERQTGRPAQEAADRFNVLCRPVKNERGIVTTNGIAVLLGLLRERVSEE